MGFVGDAVGGLLGGNDAPKPPDPYEVSGAQGEQNAATSRLETKLNRYDQSTPWGSLTWSQDPDDEDKWSSDVGLSKIGQSLLDQGQQNSLGRANAVGGMLNDWGSMGSPGLRTNNFRMPDQLPDQFRGGPPEMVTPRPETGGQWGSVGSGGEDPRNPKYDGSEMMSAHSGMNIMSAGGGGGMEMNAGGGASNWQQANNPSGTPGSMNKVGSFSQAPATGPGGVPNLQGNRSKYENALHDPTKMINPTERNALQGQNVFGGALDKAGQVNQQDFNYSSATPMPTADQATRQSVEDALYNRMSGRLDDRFQQQGAAQNSSLINQGITQGSEAWNTAQQNFGQQKNDAYQNAMNEAIMSGGQEMERQFGMGMDSRQQGVGEANALRDRPFQEADALGRGAAQGMSNYGQSLGNQANYNANALNMGNQRTQAEWANRGADLGEQYDYRNQLLNSMNAMQQGSQVQSPQFQGQQTGANVAPVNTSGNIYNSYQGDLAGYNAGVNSSNSLMGGLFGLGAAAILA